MITDEEKQAIRNLYAKVAESIPGFKKRTGQREMVAQIGRSFGFAGAADGAGIAVVEGRTGVGKTVGYLVPALVMAGAKGKKLVLSTASVALQEQLYSRDLPAVLACHDKPVKFALLKGRNRFVCPVRLDQLSGGAGQEQLFGDATWERRPEDAEIRWLRATAQSFADGQWDGELDTLPSPAPSDLWQRVANNRNTCVGRKCSRYRGCPYFKSLDDVRTADVIVANHDLVLACISAESKLLPPPEETIYVFDEAHHLPTVALNRFADEASTSARKWIDRIPAAFSRVIAAIPDFKNHASIGDLCTAISSALNELEVSLRHNKSLSEGKGYRFPRGQLDPHFSGAVAGLLSQCKDLYKVLELITEDIENAVKDNPTLGVSMQGPMTDAYFAFSRLGHFRKAIELFASPPTDDGPLAKWVTTEEGRNHGFRLCASPILAGPILHKLVWSTASAAALTSATITTLGSFEFFLRDTGLDQLHSVVSVSVASPFDYETQGEIVIPRMTADPGKADEHTSELQKLLPQHLEHVRRGALVLFASRKQMREVLAALPPALTEDIQAQGDQSRTQLITQHIERVRSGKRSILFGLASFGEGLDLPGELCEHVLIAKIPFAPPDSPIEEARAEWIEAKGGNSFMEVTLPKAGLTLIQWAGRLIRTEEDFGRVTLFDARIRTKRYGQNLLSGLPPFRRVI